MHPDIRVPFREISLSPTKSMSGEIEVNEPVRVYDTSGPWGDPDFRGDVTQGLPALRAKWIRDRGDVEEYDGRKVRPIDDGYLSDKHADIAATRKAEWENSQTDDFELEPAVAPLPPQYSLRASAGNTVTQLRTRGRASSPRRWNSSPFEKTEDCPRDRDRGRSERKPQTRSAASGYSRNDLRQHIPANLSARTSRAKSLPNLSGTKSREAEQ